MLLHAEEFLVVSFYFLYFWVVGLGRDKGRKNRGAGMIMKEKEILFYRWPSGEKGQQV
jgi:hypothetical protein